MGSRLFQFGLLLGTTVGVVACSDGASMQQRHQELTVEQNRVLGFEAPVADWSSPQSAVISASAVSSEGNSALSVMLTGYTEFHSTAISAPGSSNSQAQLDVLIPQPLAWGEVRLIVKAPSQGIYWRDLGGISPTLVVKFPKSGRGRTLGVLSRELMSPSAVVRTLTEM